MTKAPIAKEFKSSVIGAIFFCYLPMLPKPKPRTNTNNTTKSTTNPTINPATNAMVSP